MLRILGSALIAAVLAGPAHADLVFYCTSVSSSAFAPCSEPTGVFVSDNGATDTYNVILPNGDVNPVTLADASWQAGGFYELVFLDSFSVMELYLYGIGSGGFRTRLAYMFGGPDTTGATHDWQAIGTWSTSSNAPLPQGILPEPGTLAIVALALAAAGLAQRRQ